MAKGSNWMGGKFAERDRLCKQGNRLKFISVKEKLSLENFFSSIHMREESLKIKELNIRSMNFNEFFSLFSLYAIFRLLQK